MDIPQAGGAADDSALTMSFSEHSDHELFVRGAYPSRHGAQVDASVLYSGQQRRGKTRTYSESGGSNTVARQRATFNIESPQVRSRRLSHDENSLKPRKFLIDVEETMKLVLEQEDTDQNFQIAATDKGPKVFKLGTSSSNGYNTFEVRGTYQLSNLLQELALARDHGQRQIVLDEARLTENPVDRLSRMIRNSFWMNLTRRIDAQGLAKICADPKNRSKNVDPRIYVPEKEPEMLAYYRRVAQEQPELRLKVEALPAQFDARYVQSLNDKPGILALAMKRVEKEGDEPDFEGVPFVVPGARFNELYYWDSYFVALGLLADGYFDLAKGIVDHFLFQLKHYGKILNGNRSYYLCRSQPPFLSDLILQIYPTLDPATPEENKAWLAHAIRGAIKEYHQVWMSAPRLDPKTGLSRYRPDGVGIPPETEASHFTTVLRPYADKLGVSVNEFIVRYDAGEVNEPDLDEYFMHDRGIRESGHDTSYRIQKCGDLGTVDLTSLLYKYEVDIATVIRDVFDGELSMEEDFELSPFPFGTEVPFKKAYAGEPVAKPTSDPLKSNAIPSTNGVHLEEAGGEVKTATQVKQTADHWFARAERRKQLADHYLWHEGHGMYYDYNTLTGRQSLYDSVTTFYPMWSGMADQHQADKMMSLSLHKFEEAGGLVTGTEASRGPISVDRPNRQWDYPAGWSPLQMLSWAGFERYGYDDVAKRLAYRWLYMVVVGFVQTGGAVVEKFDVCAGNTNIDAEYGNQGMDFHYIPREGFGWTNASFQIGLSLLTPLQRRALGSLVPPNSLFGADGNIRQAAFPTSNGDSLVNGTAALSVS